MKAPLPDNEAARLNALYQYKVLDTLAEEAFDDLSRLAAQICGAPIALVSLVDTDRQWFKSKVGLEASETSRDIAFCAHAILQSELLIVPDARQDVRFAENPLVTTDPNIRFYAGAPLITPDGLSLGTLCALDYVPRELSSQQQAALRIVAGQVMTQLELRRHIAALAGEITQRKQLEKVLQLQDRAMAATSSGVVITDARQPERPIVYCNPAFEQITGYPQDEILGHNCRFLQGPDTDPTVRNQIRFALHEERECRVVVKNYRRDGAFFWNELAISPVRDDSGRVTHFIGVQTDITARRQAEEALQKTQNMLRLVMDNIPQFVFWKDKHLVYLGCNSNFAHLVDVGSPENIVGKTDYDLPWKQEKIEFLRESDFRVMQTDTPEYCIIEPILQADGKQAWLETTKIPLHNLEGKVVGILGTFEDITERQQAEADIRNALEKEKELSELKSSFVTTTSHEFRTPLATILSSADLLRKYSHKLGEEDKLTQLQQIKTAVANMTHLLNDVLLLGKAEAGKLECNLTPLDLLKFCHALVEELQLNVSRSPNGYPTHTVAFYSQGQCTNVCMDEKLLWHILSNLLSNAIKYSPEGSTVHFDLVCEQEAVNFQVRDEGIGIPAADQTQLFDSFYRGSNVGTIAGTGLGLAIVKKSINLHGGNITLKSEVGVGTTFRIVIPL